MTDKEIIRKMIKEQAEHYRCVCKHSEANALLDLLSIIDSMQKPVPEVVNEPIMVDAAESLGLSQEEYEKIVDECIFGKEEPVSEELEKAATNYATHLDKNWSTVKDGYIAENEKEAFKAGAEWQKENLWKDAQGDDLPEIDREVIALTQPYQDDDEHLKVVCAHRPSKYAKIWNSDLGEEQVIEVEGYDKGGWNIPDVKYWLDSVLPNMEDEK